MRSTNPVFKNHLPAPAAAEGRRLTIDDVVLRTASIFGVLLTSAALTFFFWRPGLAVLLAACLATLVMTVVIVRSRSTPVAWILGYGAVEGVVVGGLSRYYADAFGGDVVPTAVLGTLAAFAAMLGVYKSGLVRATARFRRVMLLSLLGYVVFGAVHLLGVAFGAWGSVYAGGGALALLASGAGVVFASLFLVLDFDEVERAIARGAPAEYAWRAAFGLVVTLVWVYLEVLRFAGIASSSD